MPMHSGNFNLQTQPQWTIFFFHVETQKLEYKGKHKRPVNTACSVQHETCFLGRVSQTHRALNRDETMQGFRGLRDQETRIL